MFLQLQRSFCCKLPLRSVNVILPSNISLTFKDLCSSKLNVHQIPRLFQSQCLFNRTISTSVPNWKDRPLIDKLREELSVLKSIDLKELKAAPLPALLYGFGGIIPFIFPPLYFIIGSYSPFLATSQLMYGATILAFIGGVKWGNAVAKEDISHSQIGISTVPSLVAWISLLVPEPVGFLIVSSGLVGALYIDLISSKYPPWFCTLRSTLTGVGVTSLIFTFFINVLN